MSLNGPVAITGYRLVPSFVYSGEASKQVYLSGDESATLVSRSCVPFLELGRTALQLVWSEVASSHFIAFWLFWVRLIMQLRTLA